MKKIQWKCLRKAIIHNLKVLCFSFVFTGIAVTPMALAVLFDNIALMLIYPAVFLIWCTYTDYKDNVEKEKWRELNDYRTKKNN